MRAFSFVGAATAEETARHVADCRQPLVAVLCANLPYGARGIDSQYTCDGNEFDNIDTPLAAFVLGHKALWTSQMVGKLLLRKSRFFPGCDE